MRRNMYSSGAVSLSSILCTTFIIQVRVQPCVDLPLLFSNETRVRVFSFQVFSNVILVMILL